MYSLRILVAFFCVLVISSVSRAGIGPENVIVAVNAESKVSRTVANHYVSLRGIPTTNVVLLKDVPSKLRVSHQDFKAKILQPLLDALNQRGLAAQARVIAYSADFPTSVDITEHCEKLTDPTLKKIQKNTASLNGLTFFYQFSLSDNPLYLNLASNVYARGKFDRYFINPFAGQAKDDFQSALKDLKEERYSEAATKLTALAKEHESMAPLAIKTAEAHSLANNKSKAVEFLRKAILVGWPSATYLKETESLAPLLDEPSLKGLVDLLPNTPTNVQSPIGFASNVGWDSVGNKIPANKGGVSYLLSCMLAVVHPSGSTVDQAVDVLKRSSKADRTFPDAEFHFSGFPEVRSTTRFPNVASALIYLQTLGYRTDIFRTVLPTKKIDLAGMMVGRAIVDLKSNPWTLVPGSIAENLTSYGGAYDRGNHTKITEFLHAGAAMSSGTVAEPYAIQNKFPLPMLYGYYADGATAIEAFYQSVASPYQLLIVGDPLAQAFAKPPNDWVDIALNKKGQIEIRRRSLGLKTPSTRVRQIEIFVGNRLAQVSRPVANVNINVPPNASGIMDVRVALVGFHPTEPRVSFAETILLDGQQDRPVARPLPTEDDAKVSIELTCDGADSIDLFHYGENVGSVIGESGTLKIDTRLLGEGPKTFQPVAKFADTNVGGERITIDVEPESPTP